MYKIEIKHETSSPEQMVETLRHIAEQIEQGYTCGYYPTWELISDVTKNRKKNEIEYIKGVIREWGVVNTAELELDSSPMFNSLGKDHVMLVEAFYNDWVEVVEYVHEEDTDTHNVNYEELSDDLIDEICTIMENYEADCLKTEKRLGL
jgi:hypothetical protein